MADIINESMASTPAGTLSGNASYNSGGKYTQLTPAANSNAGALEYSKTVPSAFIFESDFYANGGADANWVYWGCSSTPGNEDNNYGGYIVALDEYGSDPNKPVFLQFAGTVLAQSSYPWNLGNATKRTLKVVVDGTHILVYVNNVLLIDFTDSVRTLPGTKIGVAARTGGVNAEHRCYRIHVYDFTSPWHPTANVSGLAALKYRVIDTMKWNKDTINNQPPTAQIQAIVNALQQNANLTHIAIAIPLDIDSDYSAVGTVPSPASIIQFYQAWCDAIHNAGLGVLFRGDFNALEKSGNTANWNFIMEVGVNRLPAGTAASAATDGRTTRLGKIYQLIKNNPTWFKDGDIWAPMPERTENNSSTVNVSSITRSGSIATVTCSSNHNIGNGQPAVIAGANQADYNGSFIITKVSDTVFTYTVANSPVTPATGTITAGFGDSVFSDGYAFLPATGGGVTDNYQQLFNDLITVSNNAFSLIGKNIKTGFSANNYSEINSGWIPGALFTGAGRIAVDYYGTNHTPGEMYNDLVNAYKNKGNLIIDHEEWSDYWNGALDQTTRTDYLVNFYNMLSQLLLDGVYDMLNYWGGWVGGTGEGILTDLSSGGTYKYGFTWNGLILQEFFQAPVVTPVNTIFGVPEGYYLDGVLLKPPKTLAREYVFQKTDTVVLTGKTTRDYGGNKEKFTLTFELLTLAQVNALMNIIAKNASVSFTVSARNQINVNTKVFPFIGSIVYDTVGSDYRASVTMELIEET